MQGKNENPGVIPENAGTDTKVSDLCSKSGASIKMDYRDNIGGIIMDAHVHPAAHFIMKSLTVIFFVIVSLTHIFFTTCYAAHPLITDDTVTQGKGKFLVELNGQASEDKTDSIDDSDAKIKTKNRERELKTALTYGAMDNVDVILGAPYQWKKTDEDDVTISNVHCISDISLEIKWRFYEKERLSFALKPGFTLLTGDKNKDLGTGRVE